MRILVLELLNLVLDYISGQRDGFYIDVVD